MLGRDLLHLALEELHRDLLLRGPGTAGVRRSRLGEHNDLPEVVEVWPARPARHLAELLDRKPLDTHRERVEDDLGRREVDSRTEGSGRDNGLDLPREKTSLDLPLLLRGEPCVVCSIPGPERVGDHVRPRTGIREDDRLAVETLRGDAGVLLGAEALDRRDLLLVLHEQEVTLERDGTVVVPHEGCP